MPPSLIRAAPAVLPCAAALGIFGWWAADAGGFAVRLWAPGGLALVGLLVIAAVAARGVRGTPPLVLVAASALAAYTAWSFASTTWADDPGYAFEGATRTLIYLVVFALFALFPQRGATGAVLLGIWVVVLGAVGLDLGLRLAGSDDPASLFYFDRLSSPAGYANATAALLMMPVFPGIVLAASRSVPWWGRGCAAGIATGLACLALLTVSRGAVFSLPIVAVVFFLLVPGRVRHFYALLVPALAVAACAPRLLDVAEGIEGAGAEAVLGRALGVVAIAVAVVTVVVTVVALLEQRTGPRAARGGALVGALRALPVVLVAGGLVAGVVAVGDPVDRADAAWESFKGDYEDNDAEANRLLGGLGSARYDFYRVSLRAFADEPLTGVGADGFYQQYLLEGTSAETPRYPHSVELRALVQTGAVGAALLLVAFGAALLAAMRAMRVDSGLRRAAAVGATMAFVYWLVHGSVDWFWEWAGLGAPAFALLGLACALSRRPAEAESVISPPSKARGPLRAIVVVAGGLVLAVPFAVLWASDDQQRRAAEVYASDPLTAYAHLERAAELNPFSAAPELLAGSVALRWGDLRRADAAFARALERVPDEQYALLERGAIASALGRRASAERFLARATALAPRDVLAREAARIVRRGRTIDVGELNRRIRVAAGRLTS